MRISFVMFSLSAGGAEKVASMLANHWVGIDHQVIFLTIDSRKSDFYQLDERITRVPLGLAGESRSWFQFLRNSLRRVGRLRTAVLATTPDVVVSFLDATNVLVLLALLGSGIPVVVSERVDPRVKPTSAVLRLLRRAAYPLARALVVQTHEVSSWARELVKGDSVCVIPNPVMTPGAGHRRSISKARNAFTVVSMGRLDVQKGFDLLLKAFARCSTKHSDWHLRIIGEGPERQRLTMLADGLGITSRVHIDSITEEATTALLEGDLFVLSSRYEGFPNVLLEAMALGLPVISCDCRSGPAEIIRDGVDGVLVPPENVTALAAAMDRLMSADAERRRLAARAVEVAERFGFARVMRMWDQVLEKAAAY
jgi:GalNAc-alpha-(1->4)-GalNAc-alpha-(1->3)-diNAcBac-PP-undecaprenol alpha-1,4-N-acetyl-D-galactosaminyltransferase